MVDYNSEAFDEMSEQRKYSRAGFTKGYAMGEEAGWREGFLFGLKKGASLATEIGFYQGYTSAWLTLLEKQDQGKARKVQALRSLLEMARTFPLEEQLMTPAPAAPDLSPGSGAAALTPRLSKIRAKFRQVQGLLLDQQASHQHRVSGQSVPPATGIPASHPQPHHQRQSTLRPPPPTTHSSHAYHNWINRNSSRSSPQSAQLFAGSFDSRTSMDGNPTEMSF